MILQRRGQKRQLPDALMSVQLIPAFMHAHHCDCVKPLQCQRGVPVCRARTALESYRTAICLAAGSRMSAPPTAVLSDRCQGP